MGCSVTKSCPTLCDPMDCSTPGFPVLHFLLEFLKFMSIELVMLSNHLILCCPLLLLLSIFPNIRVFSNELALCLPNFKINCKFMAAKLTWKAMFFFIEYFRIGFTEMRQGCGWEISGLGREVLILLPYFFLLHMAVNYNESDIVITHCIIPMRHSHLNYFSLFAIQ